MSPRLRITANTLLVLLACNLAPAHAQKTASPSKWEPAIQAFEKDALAHPPTPGQVLFVGSSSIRMWKSLKQDFPGVPIIQRGFGGSQISDCIEFADRIILPYKPKLVVIYAGDNDIAAGESPQQVFQDFVKLTRLIHAHLPQTRVAFLAIKPSLARWNLSDKMKEANQLINTFSQTNEAVAYIDIYQPMLGEDGTPRKDLFLKDGLHLNAKGYQLWTSIVQPFLQ